MSFHFSDDGITSPKESGFKPLYFSFNQLIVINCEAQNVFDNRREANEIIRDNSALDQLQQRGFTYYVLIVYLTTH